ncbi:MAG TPA: hypothetical protein VGE75_03680 [Acidimicrobiales bacterium]
MSIRLGCALHACVRDAQSTKVRFASLAKNSKDLSTKEIAEVSCLSLGRLWFVGGSRSFRS